MKALEHEGAKGNRAGEARRARSTPRFLSSSRLRAFAAQTFVLLILAAACSAGPAPTPAPTRLRIAGSTSMAPALHELAAAFQAQNPNVLLEVQGGDTANGWDDLRAGRAEVAALSWWDAAEPVLEGYRLIPVARDAIAVVVHPRNPITNVTALQLRALFAGEILDWTALLGSDALGGEPGEPVVVSREDGSGTRAAFESAVMGDRRVTLNALVMPTTQAVAEYVGRHRLAVGYLTLDAVDSRIRAVPVEGLLPTQEAAESGAYHLTRGLYLAVREPASPGLQAFLDFTQSPAAVAIWNKHHLRIE